MNLESKLADGFLGRVVSSELDVVPPGSGGSYVKPRAICESVASGARVCREIPEWGREPLLY